MTKDRRTGRTSTRSGSRSVRLTKREREIALAILDGCSNREMAQRFGVVEQTIKNRLTALYRKVGVTNRVMLALFLMKHRDLLE